MFRKTRAQSYSGKAGFDQPKSAPLFRIRRITDNLPHVHLFEPPSVPI